MFTPAPPSALPCPRRRTSGAPFLAAATLVCLAAACEIETPQPPFDAGARDATTPDATTPDATTPDLGADASADATPPSFGPLAPSDLSVLFPLPATLGSPALLRLDAPGAGGALLTQERYAQIPFQKIRQIPLVYADFRVVAMRVDPCFPDLGNLARAPERCRRQMRLVAQPLRPARVGVATEALDSAIHLLYDLDAAAFNRVLDRLVELRAGRPIDPRAVLGAHPILRAEGEDGPTGAALRALILASAGASTLAELTFVDGDEFFTWRFGGLRVRGGALVPAEIHGITAEPARAPLQTISLNFFAVSVFPTTTTATALAPLYGQLDCPANAPPGSCQNGRLAATPDELRAGLATALEIEDPRRRHAESADCASCHLAGPLRARAEALGAATTGLPAFSSTWNLTLGNPPAFTGQPNRVRAFGYFHGTPVLAQRTVNEAAAVADAVNAILRAR